MKKTYPSPSLHTDLYQLTMAYGYWRQGLADRQAVFHLYFRKHPFKGSFTIAAGLAQALELVEQFGFGPTEISFLRSLKQPNGSPVFESPFLEFLSNLKFEGEIAAVPEGTLMHPNAPILRVKAPLITAQLLETSLLSVINFQTLIATKAARIVKAAAGDPVLEFGLRRAHGLDGGLSASRAAYIGGCKASSNVMAAYRFGIPVSGTHAHSWIMSFPDELTAFRAYAEAMPHNTILLVDTYDTLQGVRHAITVGHELRQKGYDLRGIRLDSGDLLTLSQQSRELLDEAGFSSTQIVASNDLDEYRISELKAQGARIDMWGVGTRLVTAYDQPALGGVYKLAAFQDGGGSWQATIKLSENPLKTSNPGIQQLFRFTRDGKLTLDVLVDEREDQLPREAFTLDGKKVNLADWSAEALLQTVYSSKLAKPTLPSLEVSQAYAQAQLHMPKDKLYHPNELALSPYLFSLKSHILSEKTGVI